MFPFINIEQPGNIIYVVQMRNCTRFTIISLSFSLCVCVCVINKPPTKFRPKITLSYTLEMHSKI